ncbi:ureidoglycolate hydrolase [Paraburkholderia sp. DHOC27]|nr:ureidoglycolate hydrolase [Paraburkholderia sp. DHOC27]
MPDSDASTLSVVAEPLDAARCEPYGWMLANPLRVEAGSPAFTSAATDFFRVHLFDAGASGETEILWVTYRDTNARIESLELHRLTQQAVVPLSAPVVQIVATSNENGLPDLSTLRAFVIPLGAGLCMRAAVWHATRVTSGESLCLMLTRASTTLDLIDHLKTGAPALESVIRSIQTHTLAVPM